MGLLRWRNLGNAQLVFQKAENIFQRLLHLLWIGLEILSPLLRWRNLGNAQLVFQKAENIFQRLFHLLWIGLEILSPPLHWRNLGNAQLRRSSFVSSLQKKEKETIQDQFQDK